MVSTTIRVVPSTYTTQPLHNTLRQAVDMREEQYHTLQREVSIQVLEAEFVSPSQAAAAAQNLKPPTRLCLTLTARTCYQLTCCILARLQCSSFGPKRRGVWWQRYNVEGHIQNYTISSLSMALPTCPGP